MNILVTGGASGLGRAVCELLAQDPTHQIVLTFHRSEAGARELTERYSNVRAVHSDFSNPESFDALIAMLPDLGLDVLVNNAITGLSRDRFHKITPERFLEGFQSNVLPAIRLVQGVLDGFKAKRSGRIITVLTDALNGMPPAGMSEYVAAKAYLASLSRSWATEYARFGIVSNAVSPAFMSTDLNREVDARIVEDLAQKHPMKRLLRPAEVAEVIAFLVTASPQINGVNLPINAGSANL